jgi:acetyltransferase-like isoleucine patch superfamily enzyme
LRGADGPVNDAPYRLIDDVEFGEGVVVRSFTNLYGCRIGDNSLVGPFVEIQRGASIGASCKIESHSFICDGVTIEDEVFVGHGVVFINDKHPRATSDGRLQTADDWELLVTTVERRASLGSGAVILGGVRIGAGAIVGAGTVVTRDVGAGETVVGNPARAIAPARRSPARRLSRRAGQGLIGLLIARRGVVQPDRSGRHEVAGGRPARVHDAGDVRG